MRSHGSLVVFTLMVQAAVGGVWCLQAAFLWNSGPAGALCLKILLPAALGLVLAGLAAAAAHLGKPGDSRHAVKNFKRSWLSREIISVGILAGILAIVTSLAHIRPGLLNGWLLLPGSLAGAASLYAMARVYRLRTVPAWNHAGTPLAFLGSALLLGGLLGTLVMTIPTCFQAASLETAGYKEYRSVARVAVLSGFVLHLLASGVTPRGVGSEGPFKTRQPVLQGLGVALGMVYILAAGNPVLQSLLLLFAAVCLVSGEIVQRIQFYASYQRVGL
ncbi:hypothetical protein D1AOALGA4SA_11545 [Olavius algarvensis Delta 1 endosymbiont]|nr:hypothetical protein D1AOALGA4SA_11545 [Olavius algarvensis Delta 1 endosymbiont]